MRALPWLLSAAGLAGLSAPAMAEDGEPPASPVEAPPARPAIMMNRWQEDWSVLADPALRTQPFDGLKYIPLSAADPKTFLSFGGSVRERFETNDAPGFHTIPGRADSYVISRLEAHADLRSGPVQVFVQFQSDFAPGKRIKAPVDSDRLDLEQGFVALTEPVGSGTLKLRLGRQQFAFDIQRFVSVRDGPNVRQSFDAAWADYEIGPWRLIGYYTQPVVNRDDHPFDDTSSGGNRFYGVRVERHVLGNNELSAYWSRFTNDRASFLVATGHERRDVWDVRFAGKTGRLDWDTEAMAQTGHVGPQRVHAWGMGSKAGYSFFATPLKPRLGIQIDAASGDRHREDGTLGTFNPLFPNGIYLNLAGYTGYANVLHVKPSVTVSPSSRLTLLGAVAAQWRVTTQDAVYTQPNVPVPRTSGTGRHWTGAYGQFRADWKANANIAAAIEAVHYDVGSTLRSAGASNSNYLGVELKCSW
ncbi:alginate export family protein [Sphingomonas sp. PR090111-T3T-6A]|uniref:alginate export family protein n=1 Tax=Sphingomonas sp. PR090111-T3T-6A TaxID=685778 RepID=UPI0003A96DB5|nr:alginate export family protein [Sphingomonas sp. PR090111-T3T-6A]